MLCNSQRSYLLAWGSGSFQTGRFCIIMIWIIYKKEIRWISRSCQIITLANILIQGMQFKGAGLLFRFTYSHVYPWYIFFSEDPSSGSWLKSLDGFNSNLALRSCQNTIVLLDKKTYNGLKKKKTIPKLHLDTKLKSHRPFKNFSQPSWKTIFLNLLLLNKQNLVKFKTYTHITSSATQSTSKPFNIAQSL